MIIQQAFEQVLALTWYGRCLVKDNMEACRAVCSPLLAFQARSTEDPPAG